MHPLVNIPSDISEFELEEKINQLSKMYLSSNNQHVKSQMLQVLETYRSCLYEKRYLNRLNKDNNDPEIDNLINVS